ncbi:MAG: flagellar basal body rod protein FlgC [Thermoleophilia bacterium]|nr:flagellar basal body rod protein FlgC [Thermoleophilia bacterium]
MSDGLFSIFGITGSGMAAERLRMDVIASNLANASTTRGADGQPYRRKEVVLQAAPPTGASFADQLAGVQVAGIVDDPTPGRKVYDPGHPDADAQGYVTLPNVNPVTEMVDLITASRGYEADVQALQAAKTLFSSTLDILK